MEWDALLRIGYRVANVTLFRLSGTEITVAALATAALLVAFTSRVAGFVERGTRRALQARGVQAEATLVPAAKTARYAVLFVGFATAIHVVGIDLGALFAAGAVFAVGIGFAMQSIAQNFVSGLILLVERAIKPGDVVEVDGEFVRVVEMGIRSTVARTRQDEELVIPNHTLAQATVRNFTYRDPTVRVRAPVGVSYDSDLKQVRSVLENVGRSLTWRSEAHEPVVLLRAFGNSAVEFELSVWTDDAWRVQHALSDINEAIWWAFRDAGIVIAYPQVDVHFDRAALQMFSGAVTPGPRDPG